VIIKTLVVGPIMANCFILGDAQSGEAAVVDPGADVDKILLTLADAKLRLRRIINTHGHFDHVGGNRRLKEVTGAEILIHAADASMLKRLSSAAANWGLAADDSPPPDRTVDQDDEIAFGSVVLKVLHTPGHSPGGISLHTNGCVFVGDTLFAGSVGRTDFPGGDFETLRQSIHQKLFVLGDDVKVYPGHGPETTIGQEKRFNPFVAMR
jgi:glyoxylase-like metal-dependent hydrolase (beta-lactamase superfamily II)